MRVLLILTATIALLTPLDAVAAAWRPPVPGVVTRSFDPGLHPFEAGRHRGVDLAAAPGAPVRAPCAGPVAFAGSVGSSGRVVTLLCGPWRVTQMPLGQIAVRAGATVAEGAPLGTAAASLEHPGLHLGVRRDGTRFGYADPLRFLAPGSRTPPPPLGPAPRSARPPRPTSPRPRAVPPHPFVAPPHVVAPPHPFVAPAPALTGSNPGLRAPFAPWPAWVGLALVLLAGAGLRTTVLASDARWPSTSPRRSTT